jgi:hypothetical protein
MAGAAMLAWGNKHLTPEGISVQLADRRSGHVLEPVLVDARIGAPITPENVMLQPGPAASAQVRARAARVNARQADAPARDEEAET